MAEAKIEYLGPVQSKSTGHRSGGSGFARLPWAFLIVVLIPTIVVAIYFMIFASPRFVSEAQFVVRGSDRVQASGLGLALQGVGLGAGSTDAFAVHEYVTSRDALKALQARYPVRKIVARPGVDIFSRYPRLWESKSEEGLYKSFQRFVTIGYDSTTGISTLRVQAFTKEDAHSLTEALLQGGEGLVNRLNTRAASDAIAAAESAELAAKQRLAEVQGSLTTFRNSEGYIDPAVRARESSEVVGALLVQMAQIRAERDQISAQAPQSPLISSLSARIVALQRQIDQERAKMAGGDNSLVPSVGRYQDLIMERELADRQYAEARAQLVVAQQEASRQKLYLERIVNPSIPDEATEPRRLFNVFAVFLTLMLFYGLGWLIRAGVREHRQD